MRKTPRLRAPAQHVGSEHIGRQAKVDQRHQSNANDARIDFIRGSNVSKEASAIADDPMGGGTGDASSGRSPSRRHSPQKSPFSSAAQACDMGVTATNYNTGRGRQPR